MDNSRLLESLKHIDKKMWIGLGGLATVAGISAVVDHHDNENSMHNIHVAEGISNVVGFGASISYGFARAASGRKFELNSWVQEGGLVLSSGLVGSKVGNNAGFGNELFYRSAAGVVGSRIATKAFSPLLHSISQNTIWGKIGHMAAEGAIGELGFIPASYIGSKISRIKQISIKKNIEQIENVFNNDNDTDEVVNIPQHHESKALSKQRKENRKLPKPIVRTSVRIDEEATSQRDIDTSINRKLKYSRAF
jgi:hypothetical protein